MASLGDEIDNCGLFLGQRRGRIFCSGKRSTQQAYETNREEHGGRESVGANHCW
jgi:hypothetical protein